MLTLLTEKFEISSAQRLLEKTLYTQLPERDGEYTIGFQGDNVCVSNLHANNKIWFIAQISPGESGPRFWNAFGIADKLKISASNSIAVEINVPVSGQNSLVAGLFARGDDGSLYLLHRGKIGGGRTGVGKQAFFEWSNLQLTPVQVSNGRTIEAVLIGKLDSPSLSDDVARFVYSVANFKAFVSNQELSNLSNKDLEVIAKKAKRNPKTVLIETTVFVRDQAVSEYAKRRANGNCDLCGEKAPFFGAQGKPYLECHHIQWLANGGSDTIDNACALCPNCHRKMHILNRPADINVLERAASKRIAKAA